MSGDPRTIGITSSERNWILRRLEADGVETLDGELANDWDIPVIIADRDILRVYQQSDQRAVDIYADAMSPKTLIIEHQAPTGPVDTWHSINRREKWTWIGIGSGATLAVCVVGLFIFGVWIAS